MAHQDPPLESAHDGATVVGVGGLVVVAAIVVAMVVAAVVVEVRLPSAVVNVQLAGAPSQPGSPLAGAAVHVISVFFGNLPGFHKLSPF